PLITRIDSRINPKPKLSPLLIRVYNLLCSHESLPFSLTFTFHPAVPRRTGAVVFPIQARRARCRTPRANETRGAGGNAAGTMLLPDELADIAHWCDARGVRLISDEIYHGLQYGRPIATAAAFSPHAVVINSFSKYFSMTGWRIGWMVLPDDLVRPVECLAQNMAISAPHVSQVAAEAAFDCSVELQGNVARYRRSRAHLLATLPAAGFPDIAAADGAFYLYADVGARTNDSVAFCARMLAEAGVAATPGVDFDRTRGSRTVRFSYCGPEADMAAAAERLLRFR
ncbi:MAG: aminotransferase class I/II-fold pyridoxal phosphate-dependent enzyme, partial [Gemmatimonadaceae bacterium]|nr:aminotransferase class I/II-fold pyridoxal phosphate-dependent enzyme [Acetobacteraceae bacterium]